MANPFQWLTLILCSLVVVMSACSSSSVDESGDLNLSSSVPDQQDQTDGITPEPVPTPDPEFADDPALPPVQSGSDLERLLSGMKRVVTRTLVDLNQALASGEALSTQQQGCLGDFEPGLGLPLLEFDCAGAPLLASISSNTVRLSMAHASFFDTQACVLSLLNNEAEACEMQRVHIDVSTEWVVPEPPQRPYPVAGVLLRYDLTEFTLSINSVEGSPAAAFTCEIDLQTTLATDTANDCDYSIYLAANRLDDLVP